MENKPIIGITIGDLNGIGPEIIIKVLSNKRIMKQCTLVIYTNGSVLAHYKKLLDNIDKFPILKIDSARKSKPKGVNIIEVWNDIEKITPGEPTKASGQCAFMSIERAVKDLKEGQIDALVTAPINKDNIQSDSFNFPGHTEYLFDQFGEEGLMVLAGDFMRVASVSGHVAVNEVPKLVQRKVIIKTAKTFLKSLKKDFGITKPKLAVLGLNPHAGDNGLFGDEEEKEIIPAITELKNSNHLVFGPYSPDGFFGSQMFQKFDGVLGMYHDQVLIPFKLLEFETGVNVTVGLSGIRTSPDHGTGFDIAGKNLANPSSFLHAIYLAIDMIKNRNEVSMVEQN